MTNQPITIPPDVDLAAVVRLAALDIASVKAINDGDSIDNTLRLASQHLKALKALSPATREWLNTFVNKDTDDD
jgi:hypothetical protein